MYAYDYIYIKKHSFIYLCFDLPPSALHHDGHRIVCPGPIYPVQVNLRSEEADLSLFFLHASVTKPSPLVLILDNKGRRRVNT